MSATWDLRYPVSFVPHPILSQTVQAPPICGGRLQQATYLSPAEPQGPHRPFVAHGPPAAYTSAGVHGIAIGWQHVIERHLESGELVNPTRKVFKTGRGFYLLKKQSKVLAPAAQRLHDWVLRECKE